MTIQDIHGHALSGADAKAADHYDAACALLRCYLNDPLAEAQAALARAPDMTMAHVLVAYLNLLGTEPAGLPVGARGARRRRALPGHRARGRARGAPPAPWPRASGTRPAASWRT